MGKLPRKHILIVGLAALVFALVGAIVGLLVASSGSESSDSVRNLTLQPNDLPPDFVLADEKLYNREELMAERPAESQIAEAGLQEAIHVSYESPDDVPVVIDVFVYGYEDEAAAETAHTYAVESDWMHLMLRRLDQERDPSSSRFSGSLADGLGEYAYAMTGELEYDDSSMTVNAYLMRSGSARAQIVISGESIFLAPDRVARNQYLRLERPGAVAAP